MSSGDRVVRNSVLEEMAKELKHEKTPVIKEPRT
jgi:hypothetical protein